MFLLLILMGMELPVALEVAADKSFVDKERAKREEVGVCGSCEEEEEDGVGEVQDGVEMVGRGRMREVELLEQPGEG